MAAVANYKPPADVWDHAAAGGRAAAKNRVKQTKEEKYDARRAYELQQMEELREGKTPLLTTSWSLLRELYVVNSEDLDVVFVDWYTRRAMCRDEAAMYLASEIGCHKDVLNRLNKRKWTTLSFAEAMLIVIDREYVTYNGEVPVYVNPRLTFRQWCLKADADCAALEWFLHTRPDQWCSA